MCLLVGWEAYLVLILRQRILPDIVAEFRTVAMLYMLAHEHDVVQNIVFMAPVIS
jgi:hypothetical protein